MRRSVLVRLMSLGLTLAQVAPLPALAGGVSDDGRPSQRKEKSKPASAEKPKVTANRTVPPIVPAPALPHFSSPPLDAEITRARIFAEPLIPAGGSRDAAEDSELGGLILETIRSKSPEGAARFEPFLSSHPDSRWNGSLLLGLGVVYRRTGYFTRALDSWERSWALLKNETDPRLRALADGAVGELAELSARLGRADRLERLFAEIEGRNVRGPASEKVVAARQGYWVMQNEPERAFLCGPFGLDRILASLRAGHVRDPKIAAAKSTRQGTSMLQMLQLADSVGLKMQIARRTPGAGVLVPALVHWKAGHFAALTKESADRLLIQDPTFGDDLWISRAALDSEASGYFLVPAGELPQGWQGVARAEAGGVWGKGQVTGLQNQVFGKPGPPPTGQKSVGGPGGNSCKGMATYTVNLLLMNLHISDTPVGYSPAIGPSMQFTVFYNQREIFQPQIPMYSNLGPKWTFDWFSYAQDDPSNTAADVGLYLRSGGMETYTGMGSGTSTVHYRSRAVLVRTSPTSYERRLADGSVEVFGQSDGSPAAPRRLYLTEYTDPQGNRVHLNYSYEPTSGGFRLVSAVDALQPSGQVSVFSYEDADPLKITKVTDPFGRFATFSYDPSGRLQRITDVMGITSELGYGDNDYIVALTTPYGTTGFTTVDYGGWPRLEVTDPLGGKERFEFNPGIGFVPGVEPVPVGMGTEPSLNGYRNTYFWDKKAMASMPSLDYAKARIYHWEHSREIPNTASGTLESEKLPLEGRVWYNYPDQIFGTAKEGSAITPTAIGRVLDDGSTQLTRYEYNALGKVTKKIDPLQPVGRETRYTYGTNNTPDPDPTTGTGIDLLKVEQKNGASYDLLSSYTYDAQHHPLTVTDVSGQTTTYTYNAQGQILTVTTPPRAGIAENRTTTYAYDTNGYQQTITGPVAGDTTTSTYDGYGRVRTVTDSNGYMVTTDYDALDRPTRVTYPDGTYEETVYNRLDPEKRRDRLGRWTHAFYDALRRVVALRDAQGRTTTQGWCACGSLDKLTDANGNSITWDRDLQGRITREVGPDGSATELTYENTTSRLKQRKDPKNQLMGYDYFLDDNLKQVTYTNAVVATSNVSFTYDPVYNRTASMIDGTGTTTYSYFPVAALPALGAGRLASVDGPLTNDTVSYTYDELGRIESRGLSGFASTYAYDVLGRIVTQGSPVGNFTSVYDGSTTRPLSLSYPNGQTTQYAYFPNAGDRRLQEIKHLAPGGSTLSKYDYTYDAQSNIQTWTQQLGASAAKVFELAYDAADQLKTATLKTTDPTPAVLKRYGYDYDPAGNRTTEEIDDSVFAGTYNIRNELLSKQAGGALIFRGTVNEPATVTVGGKPAQVGPDNSFAGQAQVPAGTSNIAVTATDPSGNTRTSTYQVSQSGSAASYTYDADGNLTGDGTKTFEYDAANRLTRVLNGGSEVARFTYDGLGRRVQRIAGGLTTSYVYDTERVAEERLSSGSTLRYVHGPGIDQHLAVQDSGSVVTYFLADHLGSIVQTTDASGQVTLSREYDPYGRPLSGAASGGYAFTGREWDPDLGLYYYRARFYDPTLARFLSADPLGIAGGTNGYAYVENAPTRFIDPTGLQLVITGPPPPPDPPVGCSAGPWVFFGLDTRSREEDVWTQGHGPQVTLPNANGQPAIPFGTPGAKRGQNGGSGILCLCYYHLSGRVRIGEVASTWERTVCCNGASYSEQRQGDWLETSRRPVPIIVSNPPPSVVTHFGINFGGSCHCPPTP
jgi:RHS repeat-associated protein